jgi:Ca2+-binding RTX toxin-like protein
VPESVGAGRALRRPVTSLHKTGSTIMALGNSYFLTSGNDVFTGTDGDDRFSDRGQIGGFDVLNGGAGDDLFELKPGSAGTIDGGTGFDTFISTTGSLGTLVFSNVERLLMYSDHGLDATVAQIAAFSELAYSYDTLHVSLYGEGGVLDFSTRLDAKLYLGGERLTSAAHITGTSYDDTFLYLSSGVLDGGDGYDIMVVNTVEQPWLGLGSLVLKNVEKVVADSWLWATIDQLLSIPEIEARGVSLSGAGGTLDLAKTAVNYIGAEHLTSGLVLFNGGAAGSQFDDILNGSELGDTMEGQGGFDIMNGNGGTDDIRGITYAIDGSVLDHGDDILNGGDGDDDLRGSLGDIMNGDAGNDFFWLYNPGNGKIDGGTGIDDVYLDDGHLGNMSFRNVENLESDIGLFGQIAQLNAFSSISLKGTITLTGSGGTLDLSTRIIGEAGITVDASRLTTASVLTGTKGNDSFRGGRGNDVLEGGAGTDIAVYSGAKADYSLVREDDGSVTIKDNRSGAERDTLKNIETLQFSDGIVDLTKLVAINLPPTSLSLSKATVAENTRIGTTIGTFSATDPESKTLVYTLTDTAGGLFKLSGNALQVAKAIDYEKVESDTITVQVSDGVHSVSRTFTIKITDLVDIVGGTPKADTLKGDVGADLIKGGSDDDALYGYGGNDHLMGDVDNDTLYGGVGADRLDGGAGIDTASYFGALKGVTASLAKPSLNTNDAKGDVYVSIENLTGTAHSDKLIGNSGANVLKGSTGGDTLYGGGGADRLDGGAGIDTASYFGALKGVTASLAKPSLNTNDAKGDVYVSIENLTGSVYSDRLVGNGVANLLTSSLGNDVLKGEGGNDALYGGKGADDLYGGTGRDLFVFKAASDSTASLSGRDTIFDFSSADRIDVSGIDANTKVSGNQTFTFIGSEGFHGKAGELRAYQKGDGTYVTADVNGDAKTDLAIHIDSLVTFDKADFLL